MHILEIPSFFPPLGGEFCIEQSKALQARGHEVRIIACNQLGVSVNPKSFFTARLGMWEETIDGITVLRRNMHGMPKVVGYNQKTWCRTVKKMYHEYVKRYGRPDILHAHCCQWAGVAASIIAKEENIPFFITEHIPSMIYETNYGKGWTRNTWAKQLLKETYEKATCVIPVSEELVDDIAPFFGKNYTYAATSNIIDTDFYAFRERESNADGRPFRLCCLAIADIKRKGFDVLAEAMKGVDGMELHIAGRGTDGEKLSHLFHESKNVVFHGELDKHGVRDLLYACDALVLASRSEVQPLVVLEAMSTGIPVVGTEVIPQSERIEGACLIAKTGDAQSLRENIIKATTIKPSPSFHDAVVKLAHRDIVAEKLEKIFK